MKMTNLIKYFLLTIAIAIYSNAYTISSGVYKLSRGGQGVDPQEIKAQNSPQQNTDEDESEVEIAEASTDSTSSDQQITLDDSIESENSTSKPEATFRTSFIPDTYKCVSSRLPKVKGSYFIFYPDPVECPLVEYRSKRKKIVEEGCYQPKPGRNGANYTIMSLKTSEPHRYEIILIDQTHGKKFNVNHLIDGEFELFCKAKKLK